jgi:hypothetical protein
MVSHESWSGTQLAEADSADTNGYRRNVIKLPPLRVSASIAIPYKPTATS